jgi:very-short-patch-repair endonuclease
MTRQADRDGLDHFSLSDHPSRPPAMLARTVTSLSGGRIVLGMGAHDGRLLRFLAETLHPLVRPEQVEVRHLHAFYNSVLAHDGYELVQVGQISGAPLLAGRRIGNDIQIVRNAENCLIYDRPLNPEGLTWADLVSWWRDRQSLPTEMSDLDAGRELCNRLWRSLGSKPEHVLFHTHAQAYLLRENTPRCPALIPQVYLHYDPQTRRQRGGKDSVLGRERMDFLLLLPHSTRVVLEVDGQQHYADSMDAGAPASPYLYAKMAAEDRALRLKGYEVYRFGGHELTRNEASVTAMLQDFFKTLLAKHPFTVP